MNFVQISAVAEQYAAKFNPDRLAPFPYENITRANPNLRIYFLPLDDDEVSGATLYKDSEYSIFVNNSKPENRQHFTLGHELGHYFLHQDILHEGDGLIEDKELDGNAILYRLDDTAYTRIETEANHFAAALLMPSNLVREAWEATTSIEKCAKIFQVSTIAMNIRLTELGFVQ